MDSCFTQWLVLLCTVVLKLKSWLIRSSSNRPRPLQQPGLGSKLTYLQTCVCARTVTAVLTRLCAFITSRESSLAPPLLIQLCRVPFGSSSLLASKLGSSHPRSLRTCSVTESPTGAFGSACLHPGGRVPILNIVFGFSLGSSIMPGVTC